MRKSKRLPTLKVELGTNFLLIIIIIITISYFDNLKFARHITGPDKEVTEKTVFECLARLNERVDQLLTVKAYFDYREELGNQREHDQHQDELPPIKNPFVGNIEQSPGLDLMLCHFLQLNKTRIIIGKKIGPEFYKSVVSEVS